MKLWKISLSLLLTVCLLVTGLTMSATAADVTKVSGTFLAGANLNLNEGIAIQFLAPTANLSGYTDTYLSVEYLDRDETVRTMEIEPVAYGDYMNYRFDAVVPDRMADNVTATLYGTKSGTEYQLGETITYSVKTYVANMYKTTTDTANYNYNDTELKTLLADILYYGEKARFYTGVSDTPLYSGDDYSWVESSRTKGTFANEVTSSVKKVTYTSGVTSATEQISWSSVGLNLRENPAILYKFKLTNKASGVSNYKLVVEVEGEEDFEYQLSAADYDRTERCYVYRFRGLNPTKMGEKVTAYFVDANGNKVSAVLDYSVESFANFCYNETNGGKQSSDAVNTELYNLTQAVIAYGSSATEFFSRINIPFRKGVNINGMEDNRTVTYITTESTYTNIKNQGFDHVRIPVGFHESHIYNSTTNTLKESYMQKLDTALDYAEKHGLYAIVDFHGWYEIDSNDAAQKEKFLKIWGLVAERYKNRSEYVVFELMNEPHLSTMSVSKLNSLQAEAIALIRKTNPNRLIICAAPDSCQAWMLTEQYGYSLPKDDKNLAVAVHLYSPGDFTHQGFTWAGKEKDVQVRLADVGLGGLNYDLKTAKDFSDRTGIPVIFNEFGLNLTLADQGDSATFIRTITDFCRENRIAWAWWEYKDWGDPCGEMALYRNGKWDTNATNALFLR